jgi:hypothetical protein
MSVTNRTSKLVLVFALLGYVVLLSSAIWAMTAWRQSLITNLSTPEAQVAWEKWRAEAAQEDGTHGPVQRTVPKSPEPPSLVLMRDYFPACLVGLLLPLSALYAFIVWLVCGVLQNEPIRSSEKNPSDG